MIGIYKITSPSSRIYIGQSINIKKRFASYKILSNCSGQRKLFRSLKKYGAKKHVFEVLTECSIAELNDLERYYQDLYCAAGVNGLNCLLTKSSNRKGMHSEETKRKIGISVTGYIHTEETKNKIRNSHIGKVRSQETKDKISQTRKVKLIPAWNKGIPRTEEVKAKLRTAKSGRLTGSKHPLAKTILNLETGVFFDTMKEAALSNGLNYSTLNAYLKNIIPNRTSLIFV